MTTGVVLVFLTPPFQAPDEPCHFLRISSYLEGNTFPVRGPEDVYSLRVSSWIMRDVGRLTGQTPFHPERRYDSSLVKQALAQPVRQSAPALSPHCPGAVIYNPVAYAPQLVGVGAMALGKASVPIRLWAGRLTNLCFFVCLTFFALRLLPSRRDVLLALALMPMTLFQAASLSPDSALNALLFLFIAYVLHLQSLTSVRLGQAAKLLVLGLGIGLIKSTYLPITASAWLLLPAAFRSWRQGQRGWPLHVILVLPACVFAASWAWQSTISPYFDPRLWHPGIDVELQKQWMAAHPAAVLRRLAVSLAHTHERAGEFVGVLGWLDTPIPSVWRILYGALLAMAAFGCIKTPSESPPPHGMGPTTRLVLTFLAVSSVLLVYSALMVIWEKVGDGGPIVIQGRYLIPAALPVLLALELPARWRRAVSIPRAVLVGALVVSQMVLLWTVWTRYYGV
jgi:uncharacterized membrane protein